MSENERSALAARGNSDACWAISNCMSATAVELGDYDAKAFERELLTGRLLVLAAALGVAFMMAAVQVVWAAA